MITLLEAINIIAIVSSPIIAVIVSQWLQNRGSKRKDKMQIFQLLWANRIHYWSERSAVNSLNSIEVVFSDSKDVLNAWEQYYNELVINKTTDLEIVKYYQNNLLLVMASDLGYDNITRLTADRIPYHPDGLYAQDEAIKNQQCLLNELASSVSSRKESNK